MELFFRKYFWTVTTVFTLAVALIAAMTVNLFVEGLIAPSGASTQVRVAPRPISNDVIATLSNEQMSKITGLPLPPPPVPSGPEVMLDPNATPVRTSLRVKLMGTMVSVLPEWSVASVQDVSTTPQKINTYFVGDKIQGAEVLEIERNQVIIRNNGRKEFIDGEAGDGAVAVAVAPPGNGVPSSDDIKELGANQYEVKRDVISNAMSNLNDIAMQARIVPSFKDGVSNGFKLFSIRPDSLYTKIGVINGDVIKRINGYEMNDPAKALEVYTKLKDASRVDIEIDRNGQNVHKTYSIH